MRVVDVGKAASRALAQALPEVFDSFKDAAARVSKKDLEALLTTENLRGLTSVFTDRRLSWPNPSMLASAAGILEKNDIRAGISISAEVIR